MYDHDDYKNLEPSYRRHYQASYGTTNLSFEDYEPAYRYGHALRSDDQFRQYKRWQDFEAEARQRWEEEYSDNGLWEDLGAVRHAWEESIQDGVEDDETDDYDMGAHSNRTVEEETFDENRMAS